MGNKPVQHVNRHQVFFQCLQRKTAQSSDGNLEDFPTIHVNFIQVLRNHLRCHRQRRAAGRNMKHLPEGAVRQQMGGKNAVGGFLLRSLNNGGPGAVTK